MRYCSHHQERKKSTGVSTNTIKKPIKFDFQLSGQRAIVGFLSRCQSQAGSFASKLSPCLEADAQSCHEPVTNIEVGRRVKERRLTTNNIPDLNILVIPRVIAS